MKPATRIESPVSTTKPALNPETLNQLIGQMVNDLGSAVSGALVVLGDELGIYIALAEVGPATSEQLAKKTKLHERQLREWLSAQAASGYVSHDAPNDAFFLTPEQVAVFADRSSPAAMTGGFFLCHFSHLPRYIACCRQFSNRCGAAMGKASQLPFLRDRAVLPSRVSSQHQREVDTSIGGRPIGAASHVERSLQPDGTFMVVEPFAGDSLAENINPVGRVYYGFSAMICTPGSLSQEVGLALGAQAGERRLKEVLSAGGFTRVRRAAETPFNMILEARP